MMMKRALRYRWLCLLVGVSSYFIPIPNASPRSPDDSKAAPLSSGNEVAILVRRKIRYQEVGFGTCFTELFLKHAHREESRSGIQLPAEVAQIHFTDFPPPLRFSFSKDARFVAAMVEENFSQRVMLCNTSLPQLRFVDLPTPDWTAILSTPGRKLDAWLVEQHFDIVANRCEFTTSSILVVTYKVIGEKNVEADYKFSVDCRKPSREMRLLSRGKRSPARR